MVFPYFVEDHHVGSVTSRGVGAGSDDPVGAAIRHAEALLAVGPAGPGGEPAGEAGFEDLSDLQEALAGQLPILSGMQNPFTPEEKTGEDSGMQNPTGLPVLSGYSNGHIGVSPMAVLLFEPDVESMGLPGE